MSNTIDCSNTSKCECSDVFKEPTNNIISISPETHNKRLILLQQSEKKHHRTDTQYSLKRVCSQSSDKGDNINFGRKSSISYLELASDKNVEPIKIILQKDKLADYLQVSTLELKKEKINKNKLSKSETLIDEKCSSIGKQVFLFYRTPSSKEGKSISFDNSKSESIS